MEEQWHILRGGNQSGPHTLGELQRLLEGADLEREQVLVWTERLTEWADPRTVPGVLSSGVAGGGRVPVVAMKSQPDMAQLNPYAAPASALVAEQERRSEEGPLGNYELEVGACLETGWKLTLKHFFKLIGFGLAYLGVVMLVIVPLEFLGQAAGAPQQGEEGTAVGFLVLFLNQIVQNLFSVFVGIGAVLFGLGMVRRTKPGIGLLFAGGPHFFSVLGATILVMLAVLGGLLLLIIPGIYLGVRMSQYQYAIVDRKLGPIDGIKASWEMTKGNFWHIVLLGLASFGIVILGVLGLGVGLLWAYPTVMLASVAAYICMSRGVGSLPKLG